MGYAAVRWFEKGEKLSSDALQKLTRSLTATLLENLKSFGKRKPGRQELQATIAQSLQDYPMAESRAALDNETTEPL
jgi:hypothetical protein